MRATIFSKGPHFQVVHTHPHAHTYTQTHTHMHTHHTHSSVNVHSHVHTHLQRHSKLGQNLTFLKSSKYSPSNSAMYWTIFHNKQCSKKPALLPTMENLEKAP